MRMIEVDVGRVSLSRLLKQSASGVPVPEALCFQSTSGGFGGGSGGMGVPSGKNMFLHLLLCAGRIAYLQFNMVQFTKPLAGLRRNNAPCRRENGLSRGSPVPSGFLCAKDEL